MAELEREELPKSKVDEELEEKKIHVVHVQDVKKNV